MTDRQLLYMGYCNFGDGKNHDMPAYDKLQKELTGGNNLVWAGKW